MRIISLYPVSDLHPPSEEDYQLSVEISASLLCFRFALHLLTERERSICTIEIINNKTDKNQKLTSSADLTKDRWLQYYKNISILMVQ